MKFTKIVAIALTLVMLTGIMTACGNGNQETSLDSDPASSKADSSSSEERQPVKLNFWSGIPEAKGPMQAMEAYSAINNHITFEFTQLGWDDASNTRLDTALMSGIGVDVFMPTRGAVEKAERGLALDLTQFLERDGINLLENIGEDVKDLQFDGKFYSIPLSTLPLVWLLNKNMFDAAGVDLPDDDWTVEDMREIAKKLTNGENESKVYGVYFTHNWPMYWLFSLGSGYFPRPAITNADRNEVFLNQDNVLYTLETMLSMQNEDKSVPSYTEKISENYWPSSVFLSGKAAMVATGTYVLRDVKDKENYPHDIVTAFALPPIREGQENKYHNWSLEDPIMINSKSVNLDESWEFLKWMFTDGVEHLVEFGRMPSYANFSTERIFEAFIGGYEDMFDADSFRRYIDSDRIRTPQIYGFNEEMAIIGQEVEKALVGQVSAEQALQTAQERVTEHLKQKN